MTFEFLNIELLKLGLLGLSVMVLLMFILWIIHIPLKNAGIVDVGWGGGLVILAVIYYLFGSGYEPRKLLITLMVLFWGTRLTIHLAGRVFGNSEEDGRYVKIRESWKSNINLKFFFFFEFQGVLNIILSLPFLLIAVNKSESISMLEWTGLIIWAIAFFGELIADKQLKEFKRNPQNIGKVCNVKLWNYSRHPNYFFEFLIWVGYSVTAFSSPNGWLAIISPLIILYLLLFVTGIPATEAQALRSKGNEYKKYMESTSKFIPWRKKTK